jgi:hypothetical protein
LFTTLGAEGEQLEFGYCFDVSIRAFFPVWLFLYVVQFLLMPVIAKGYWYVLSGQLIFSMAIDSNKLQGYPFFSATHCTWQHLLTIA